MTYFADITEIHKEMLEKGYTPQLIAEKFAQVQPIPPEAFQAAHTLMKFKWKKVPSDEK